jgi:hypothetical protein
MKLPFLMVFPLYLVNSAIVSCFFKEPPCP